MYLLHLSKYQSSSSVGPAQKLTCTPSLQDQLIAAKSIGRQNDIARTRSAFTNDWRDGLLHYDHPRWWEFRLGPPTPHPSHIKLTCAPTLGTPKPASCENALFQFMRSGLVTLGPRHPIIRTAGNCAIGVSAPTKQTTTWDILRTVAESLLAGCVASPHPQSGHTGGYARSVPISGRRKRQTPDPDVLPGGVTIAFYLQQPFAGSPSQTCAWDAADSHQDVRKCPAQRAPWRPPERKIMQKGNLTEVIKGNTTYVTEGDSTDVITEENLIEVLSEFPLFPSSTSTAATGGEDTGGLT